MRAAVITAAGISSRFNQGIPDVDKKLKAIYYVEKEKETLLFRLLEQCSYADRIVVVGGYQFEKLEAYVKKALPGKTKEKVELVYNSRFEDLASGYSLYIGLKKIFEEPETKDILFVEGDLDIDRASFRNVVKEAGTVLTYNYESIYADKSVVLYRDGDDRYRYAFNSTHGLLEIQSPFSCVLNSGQLWKFADIEALKQACRIFYNMDRGGTNLKIIQEYLNRVPEDQICLLGLKRWTNCNTRADYEKIRLFWREES